MSEQALTAGPGVIEGGTTLPGMTPTRERSNGKRKRISIIIFVSLVVIGAGVGLWYYLSTRGFESTDDAFISGNVYQIAPKVAGRLLNVPVKDNQVVGAGETLARIETADYESALAQAQAAFELAQAQRHEAEIDVGLTDASTNAAVATADAQLEAARAQLQQEMAGADAATAEAQRTSADFERYSTLSDRAVTPQRLDLVRTTAENAQSSLRAAEKRVAAANAEVTAAESRLNAAQAERERVEAARAALQRREAEVRQAQAALDRTRLDLSYTTIIAPADGRVTMKNAMPGDYVSTGQNLMALVSPDTWVIANFKETQLRHIAVGQPVRVHVDAYNVDLDAHVQSIQAGSGAQFSLLPPQNATGNYVKVVQRVPVKIVFDNPQTANEYLLGPGMSVVPRVDTR